MANPPARNAEGSGCARKARAVLLKGSASANSQPPGGRRLKAIDAYRFRGREPRIADGIIEELLRASNSQRGRAWLPGTRRRGDTLSEAKRSG